MNGRKTKEMDHNTKDKPVSTYISVKPEYIIAATPPVYRDEKLELYRNSDIAPNGALYIETPGIEAGTIIRRPVLLEASPDKFILLLRKTDASGHALSPATRDNTRVYLAYVQDYAEARALMTHFEEHAEKLRQIHQRNAVRESLSRASTKDSSPGAATAPSARSAPSVPGSHKP